MLHVYIFIKLFLFVKCMLVDIRWGDGVISVGGCPWWLSRAGTVEGGPETGPWDDPESTLEWRAGGVRKWGDPYCITPEEGAGHAVLFLFLAKSHHVVLLSVCQISQVKPLCTILQDEGAHHPPGHLNGAVLKARIEISDNGISCHEAGSGVLEKSWRSLRGVQDQEMSSLAANVEQHHIDWGVAGVPLSSPAGVLQPGLKSCSQAPKRCPPGMLQSGSSGSPN